MAECFTPSWYGKSHLQKLKLYTNCRPHPINCLAYTAEVVTNKIMIKTTFFPTKLDIIFFDIASSISEVTSKLEDKKR